MTGCCCSSGVEHFLGKEEVEGSIPFNSSKVRINVLEYDLKQFID
jgi:hypothetical protein